MTSTPCFIFDPLYNASHQALFLNKLLLSCPYNKGHLPENKGCMDNLSKYHMFGIFSWLWFACSNILLPSKDTPQQDSGESERDAEAHRISCSFRRPSKTSRISWKSASLDCLREGFKVVPPIPDLPLLPLPLPNQSPSCSTISDSCVLHALQQLISAFCRRREHEVWGAF